MVFGSSNTPNLPGALQGLRILTTRPAPLAARLVEPLQAAGAQVENLPLLTLEPRSLTPAEHQCLLDLDNFHKVIVISPSAAHFLMDRLDDYWPQWPLGVNWFTVGAGTADCLSKAGLEAVFPERGDTSEDLLALPVLQAVAEQKILLAKGEGGRPLLAATLKQRGARVQVLSLYQRKPARLDPMQYDLLQQKDYDFLVLTSGEALQHYVELAIKKTIRLVVPSKRLLLAAQEAGFTQVINSQGASAQAIIKALKEKA